MKRMAVLGTGMVGNTIASKLIALGYPVMMGSRSAANEKANEWVLANGDGASAGTFSDAARFGELVFNCTQGDASASVLRLAGIDNLAGKILIDVSNPLDFSMGTPPSLLSSFSNTNSLGEELQRAVPLTHVVKALNMVNCEVMVDGMRCGGEGTMFMAGNSREAKMEVMRLLGQFGWKDIIDLGGIIHSRGMEMILPLWMSVYSGLNSSYFGFKVVR